MRVLCITTEKDLGLKGFPGPSPVVGEWYNVADTVLGYDQKGNTEACFVLQEFDSEHLYATELFARTSNLDGVEVLNIDTASITESKIKAHALRKYSALKQKAEREGNISAAAWYRNQIHNLKRRKC